MRQNICGIKKEGNKSDLKELRVDRFAHNIISNKKVEIQNNSKKSSSNLFYCVHRPISKTVRIRQIQLYPEREFQTDFSTPNALFSLDEF